jgi:hypothetical protein
MILTSILLKEMGVFFVFRVQRELKKAEREKDSTELNKYPVNRAFQVLPPAEVSLTTGTYQLFPRHQLYEQYKDSVIIEKGQTKTVNIKLSPERKE